MSARTIRFCVGLTGWGLALLGSLSIARLPGDWGHGVCGPWGCGPPLQSLVACHLAWLVALAPIAVLPASFSRVSPRSVYRIGSGLAALGVLGLLAIVLHEGIDWLPNVDARDRAFFLQRCGFVIVTTVDLPLVQIFMIGVVLAVGAQVRDVRERVAEKHSTALAAHPHGCPTFDDLRGPGCRDLPSVGPEVEGMS